MKIIRKIISSIVYLKLKSRHVIKVRKGGQHSGTVVLQVMHELVPGEER